MVYWYQDLSEWTVSFQSLICEGVFLLCHACFNFTVVTVHRQGCSKQTNCFCKVVIWFYSLIYFKMYVLYKKSMRCHEIVDRTLWLFMSTVRLRFISGNLSCVHRIIDVNKCWSSLWILSEKGIRIY